MLQAQNEDLLKFTLDIIVSRIETEKPLEGANVKIIGTDGSLRTYISDSLGTTPTIKLKPNTSYSIIIEKIGYLNAKGKETTVGLTKSRKFLHEYGSQSICGGFGPPIPKLYFLENEKSINKDSLKTVDFFHTILIENPTLIIQVEGFQDEAEKQKISLKRAKEFKNLLIEKGIHKDRLKIKDGSFRNYKKRTYEPELTEEEIKQNNRTVIIKVIGDDFQLKK